MHAMTALSQQNTQQHLAAVASLAVNLAPEHENNVLLGTVSVDLDAAQCAADRLVHVADKVINGNRPVYLYQFQVDMTSMTGTFKNYQFAGIEAYQRLLANQARVCGYAEATVDYSTQLKHCYDTIAKLKDKYTEWPYVARSIKSAKQ